MLAVIVLPLPSAEADQPPLTVVYSYVPGAGDDEESWARGLTPALLWQHKRRLLAAGLEGIEFEVQWLIEEEERQLAGAAGAAGAAWQQGAQQAGHGEAAGETGAATQQGAQHGQHGQQDRAAGSAPPAPLVKSKWRSVRRPAVDRHHEAPLGCRPAAAAGATAAPAAGGGGVAQDGIQLGIHSGIHLGIHYLGDTGLAVGAMAAGASPEVWSHVGAVLNVGLWEHPGMAQERASSSSSSHCSSSNNKTKSSDGGSNGSTAQQMPAAVAVLGVGDGGGQSPAPPPLPRYAWLPVPHSNFERQGLRAALPAAVEFVSRHLQAGQRVLIHCDDGECCTFLAVGKWGLLSSIAERAFPA